MITKGLKEARSEALQKELKILIDWINNRVNSDRDELTTITMLRRKITELEKKVNAAGYQHLTKTTEEL